MGKFNSAKQFINQIFGGAVKTTGTGAINKVDIAKNLKGRFEAKQKTFKSIDDQTKGTNVSNQKKSELKKSFSEKASNIFDKASKKRKEFKKGTPKRKSKVEKIKKTFGPKSLGMQSVIYGLDKNPNITKADPKAKFIAAAMKKKKKKVI